MANFPITLTGPRISPLVLPERNGDYTVRYYIPYTDIAVASATGNADTITVTLGTTPANWQVTACYAFVSPVFAGTTALTLTCGTTTSPSAFLASTTVLTAGTIQPSGGPGTVNLPTSSFGSSSITIQCVFTNATGGSPSLLTTGAMEILLAIIDPSQVP